MSASLPIVPDTTEERTLREVRKVPARDFRNQKTRVVAAHLVLGHSLDYVSLNFCSNLAASMAIRDLGRCVVGCDLQLALVPGFDLIAQGSSLTVCNGRMPRRGCAALIGPGLDYHA